MEGKRGRQGPFRPGAGGLPPYLAGRATEQAFFRDSVLDLADGLAPPAEVVLYGPRGNGKTALLVWLEREIAATAGVEAVRLTPAEARTTTELAEQLLPDSFWAELAPTEVSVAGLTRRPGRQRPPRATEALAVRARAKPVVVLLDEAHTLDLDVGRALLNASQQVGRELPLLLVLAGTPNLRDHLSRMGASFWNRAERLPISRLGPEASAAAIRRPLEAEEIAISDAALAEIVRESHGYPFFLQWWGRLVWRRALDAGGGVTGAEVEAARPEFERRRGGYYLERYEEFEELGLLAAARAVADAFRERQTLSPEELAEAAPAAALQAFRRLGFIWRVGPDPRWEPGIPSLMDYIREQVPAP